MLDGRVLGASQVEYKPFGKLPLKREVGELGSRGVGESGSWGVSVNMRVWEDFQ